MKQNGAGYVLIYSILSCPILSANPCPNAFPVLCHYDISHLPVPPGFSFYQGLLCSSNESAPLLEFLCSFWKLSVGRGKWLCPPKKNKRRSLMEERTTNAEDPRPTATPRNSSPPLLAPSSAACRQLDPPKLPIRLEFLKGRIPAEGLQQVFFAQLTKDHSKSSFFKASNSFSCSLSCLQSEHQEFWGQNDARVPGSGCLHCHQFNASGKMLNC